MLLRSLGILLGAFWGGLVAPLLASYGVPFGWILFIVILPAAFIGATFTGADEFRKRL